MSYIAVLQYSDDVWRCLACVARKPIMMPRPTERLRLTSAHLLLSPSAASPQRPAGHRLEGVPTMTATPAPPGGELSQGQLEAYSRDGCILISGLIAPEVVAAATDAMWAQMAAENRDCGGGSTPLLPVGERGDSCVHPRTSLPQNQRTEPASWTGDGDWPVKDNAAVMTLFTPAYLRAAQLLAAAHARTALYPVVEGAADLSPPTSGLAINRFPHHAVGPYAPVCGPWPASPSVSRPNGYVPHSDYGYRPKDVNRHSRNWRERPQPVYIQHFTYLGVSATEPGGGGTLVWPGSHRALARAYVEAPSGLAWMGPILDTDTNDKVRCACEASKSLRYV